MNLLDENTLQNGYDKSSITAILAEHVWEHLTYEEGIEAAKMCFKYLMPSNYIRCAVPDGYFPDETYQTIVQVGGPGPRDHPAASHKMVHNYKTLTKMFKSAGYEGKLLEYHIEKGDFHQNYWDGVDGVIFVPRRMTLETKMIGLFSFL